MAGPLTGMGNRPLKSNQQLADELLNGTPVVLRCAWCPDLVLEGPFATVHPIMVEHRRAHGVKEPRRKRGRSAIVGDTRLEENISRAREYGSIHHRPEKP